MNTNNHRPPSPDLSRFHENWCNFPPEQLVPYHGRFVAWSPDGTRILASGSSYDEVDEELRTLGIHFSEVVHDHIDPPDVVIAG